jgi:hypothetical protein
MWQFSGGGGVLKGYRDFDQIEGRRMRERPSVSLRFPAARPSNLDLAPANNSRPANHQPHWASASGRSEACPSGPEVGRSRVPRPTGIARAAGFLVVVVLWVAALAVGYG